MCRWYDPARATKNHAQSVSGERKHRSSHWRMRFFLRPSPRSAPSAILPSICAARSRRPGAEGDSCYRPVSAGPRAGNNFVDVGRTGNSWCPAPAQSHVNGEEPIVQALARAAALTLRCCAVRLYLVVRFGGRPRSTGGCRFSGGGPALGRGARQGHATASVSLSLPPHGVVTSNCACRSVNRIRLRIDQLEWEVGIAGFEQTRQIVLCNALWLDMESDGHADC